MGSVLLCVLDSYRPRSIRVLAKLGSLLHRVLDTFVWVGTVVGKALCSPLARTQVLHMILTHCLVRIQM